MIDHALGIIHRSYPGIKVETVMPCNCEVCSVSSEPGTFTVSELLDFARTSDPIQCRVSRKLLDPVKLLNTLFVDASTLRVREPRRRRSDGGNDGRAGPKGGIRLL